MNWLTRKIGLFRKCLQLADGVGEALNLARYQFKGGVGDQFGAPASGYLKFRLKLPGRSNRALCHVRPTKSDWIIFREIFVFDDYQKAGKFSFTPKVIYDVGANAGLAAVYFHLIFPEAVHYGFEPGETEFACAEKNYLANQFGTVFPVAVGDQDADLPFYVDTDRSGGQGFCPSPGPANANANAAAQLRPVRRLEAFAADHRLPAPDLIKMDIEGFEVKALKGMGSLLAQARGIIMETHGPELHAECLGILKQQGFQIIADDHRSADFRILVGERSTR